MQSQVVLMWCCYAQTVCDKCDKNIWISKENTLKSFSLDWVILPASFADAGNTCLYSRNIITRAASRLLLHQILSPPLPRPETGTWGSIISDGRIIATKYTLSHVNLYPEAGEEDVVRWTEDCHQLMCYHYLLSWCDQLSLSWRDDRSWGQDFQVFFKHKNNDIHIAYRLGQSVPKSLGS